MDLEIIGIMNGIPKVSQDLKDLKAVPTHARTR